MFSRLFDWARQMPKPAASSAASAGPEEPPPAACPPCTGRCFQGRACPASPSADPALVALLRRSPQQAR